MILTTACGKISGLEKDGCNIFLGVPYAKAARFEYAVPVTKWNDNDADIFDATKAGKACPQMRSYHEHLEIAERAFYHREFREGLSFEYDEDCLNLNIYTPALDCETEAVTETTTVADKKYPVMIFIHGGGFDSGANCESAFDGTCYAKRGIICIFINYRVGIFGYLTHSDIQKKFGRNGNFGLDDQLTAIKWIKAHISDFGGDAKNITVAGQSAGAISIQYLCLNHKNEGLFKNAFMISGGGKFPDFALPRKASQTEEYWKDFMAAAGVEDFETLKKMSCQQIFDVMDKFKPTRKDNTYNTMPVIDGFLIPSPIQTLIKNPIKINYLLGYTNCDLYAPLMAMIGHKFARDNKGFIYFFDVDAKGDNKKAFHSSDLRFVFGTLNKSWRPYDEKDYKIAELMHDYIENFVKYGNPNGNSDKNEENQWQPLHPVWKRGGKKALHFTINKKIKMIRPRYIRLALNMFSGGKQI